MAQKKQNDPAKVALENAKDSATPFGEQTERVTKAAGHIFGKLMAHLEAKKVDEWQKKWLAVPEHRKKYEKVTDAPEVVGEELLSMTNDIIDFIQKKTAKPDAKKPAKASAKAPAKSKKAKK